MLIYYNTFSLSCFCLILNLRGCKAYGISKPKLFFDCVNIYDYGRFNNYNEASHSTGQIKTIDVQFNSDVVTFFGFIPETEKDAIIQAAKQIRQNSPKSKK